MLKTKKTNKEHDKETLVDSAVRDLEDSENAEFKYQQFFGRGEKKYLITPSFWKSSWGKPPILGVVKADNEFLAERLAYDRGILPTPFNCTFQPKFKEI